MNRRSTILFFALVFAGVSCDSNRSADDGDHTHGVSAGVAVTHWTDRTELFMEYPSLVAGKSARAAIHVTTLPAFAPLDEGEATVTLRSTEGRVLQFRGGPSSPGIFGVDLAPDRAGVYEMSLTVEAPGLDDIHELGPVTVHPPGAAPGPQAADDGEISFLKEQQWTLEFGTVAAEVRSLRSGVTVPGTIRPRSGGEARLSAPVPGRISGSMVPIPGSVVRSGELLVRIAPRPADLRDAAAMRAALVEAEQEQGLAVRELERVERLVTGRALPARRLDEAVAGLKESEARLTAARQRWGHYESLGDAGDSDAGATLAVRAPFDGVVAEVRFSPGADVEENQFLLSVVDPDRVHVVGAVPEFGAANLRSIVGGELLLDEGSPLALEAPLAVGRVIDPIARTTEVRFAFDNRAGLQIGRHVNVRLFVGNETPGTAVPESAIVDDAGRPVVFVQLGGESFARRPVRLGTRAGGWVQILEGVEAGERVVHVGAYLVRLAAMSSQIPSHGHVH